MRKKLVAAVIALLISLVSAVPVSAGPLGGTDPDPLISGGRIAPITVICDETPCKEG